MASYTASTTLTPVDPPLNALQGALFKEFRPSSNSDPERFDFDQWVIENGLEEIKDCLIDHNMNTVKTLDLYSANAIKLMRDDRITDHPQIMPILMSAIISLKSLKIVIQRKTSNERRGSEHSATGYRSGDNTPISTLSTAYSITGGRSSRKSSLHSPFAYVPTLHDLPSWGEWEPNTPLSEAKQAGRVTTPKTKTTISFKESPKMKPRAQPPLSGLNIPLSGLNVKNTERKNFAMNNIDAYNQTIIQSLQTETSKQYPSALKTWILNICFYILLALFIYFNIINSNIKWIFLVILVIIWIIYTFEWMVASPSAPIAQDGQLYDKESIYKEIRRFHKEKPMIKWSIKCYHSKEIEKDYNGYIDKNLVREETLENEDEYSYTSWKDISKEFDVGYLDECPFTQLTIYKSFDFGNERTEDDYYHRAELFRKENDNDDDYQYFGQWMELNGWCGHKSRASHILVKRDNKESMALVSKLFLALFSCLMCGACYRTYVSKKVKTNKMDYVVLKEISL